MVLLWKVCSYECKLIYEIGNFAEKWNWLWKKWCCKNKLASEICVDIKIDDTTKVNITTKKMCYYKMKTVNLIGIIEQGVIVYLDVTPGRRRQGWFQ